MICQKCKAELLDGYTFCPQCGSSITPAASAETEAIESTADVPETTEQASDESVYVKSDDAAPIAEETPVVESAPIIDTPPIESAPPIIAPAPVVESAPPAVSPEPKKKDVVPEPVLPKEYKPLKTAGVFWYFFLTGIPVVNLIVVLSFAFGSKNKNRKSLARATLIWWIITIIIMCGLFVFVYFAFNGFMTDLVNADNSSDIADAFNNMSFGS